MTKRYIRSCQIESVSLDLHGRVSPDLSNLYLPENNRHYKVSEEVKNLIQSLYQKPPTWITCKVSLYMIDGVHLKESEEYNALKCLWLYSYNGIQGILKSISYNNLTIFDSEIEDIYSFLVENRQDLVSYFRRPLSISVR